jgi:DNA-directed RNA polymerase subunit RPC12/RpoP
VEYKFKTKLTGPVVVYDCPRCSSALNSKLKVAGKMDECPECGMRFIVPGEAERNEMERREGERREAVRIAEQRRIAEWREAEKREVEQQDTEQQEIRRREAEWQGLELKEAEKHAAAQRQKERAEGEAWGGMGQEIESWDAEQGEAESQGVKYRIEKKLVGSDIVYNCRNCFRSLVSELASAGQLHECPQCGERSVVPGAADNERGMEAVRASRLIFWTNLKRVLAIVIMVTFFLPLVTTRSGCSTVTESVEYAPRNFVGIVAFFWPMVAVLAAFIFKPLGRSLIFKLLELLSCIITAGVLFHVVGDAFGIVVFGAGDSVMSGWFFGMIASGAFFVATAREIFVLATTGGLDVVIDSTGAAQFSRLAQIPEANLPPFPDSSDPGMESWEDGYTTSTIEWLCGHKRMTEDPLPEVEATCPICGQFGFAEPTDGTR